MKAKNERPGNVTSAKAIIDPSPTDSTQLLRRRAEKIYLNRTADLREDQESPSFAESRQMLYELQVHRIELEIQNEELRRTQAELGIIHERYFDLYDMAPVGYCTLSEKGLLLEVNLTAATMFGATRRELIHQPISLFICKEDQSIYYLNRKKLLATRQPQTYDLRMVKKDGISFWATLVETATQDADGNPLYRMVISDITELKKTQEEKNKHKLEILQKKAQRMQSIGRLAGGIAHEFNNMLGVIMGYSELALNHLNPSQPLYADLWEIRKAGERCADLTRKLLAFAGRQVFAPEVLDLNQTVKAKLESLRQAMGDKIDLVWQPRPGIWAVNIDQEQFGDILTNLCENAGDAIVGQGIITIDMKNVTIDEASCAGHPWLLSGDYVQLTINDNGWGIDKAAKDNLFEPFFTTKEMHPRSGLGLAAVYGIVKQNKGFIDADSTPKEGTTFTIYLPRSDGSTNRIEQTESIVQPAMSCKGNILVVEDEPIFLELVTTLLSLKGYKAITAKNAQEAVHLAHKHAGTIDLLLTDVLMPEMNGDELAQKLLAENPSLKCLFMSGYTSDVITHRGLLDTTRNFIQKPFAADDLFNKIQQVMKGRI